MTSSRSRPAAPATSAASASASPTPTRRPTGCASGSSRPRGWRRADARRRVNADARLAARAPAPRRGRCASAATPSSAPSAAAASAASGPTGTARTRSAGAAARTSATARWRCCGASARELLGGAARVLHFAPEWCFRLRATASASATSAPTSTPARATSSSTSARSTCPTRPSTRSICSHVLEHVDRDRDALAELRRIVDAGGWVLLMVPQDLGAPRPTRTRRSPTPAARRAAYWQHDHVRLYGRDFADRIARGRLRRRGDRR